MIAANLVGKGKGFCSDENEIILISKSGDMIQLGMQHKSGIAEELLSQIAHQIKI